MYDNDRFEDKTPFHEQWIVFNSSKPSFDLKGGNVGLGSISFDLITGGWLGQIGTHCRNDNFHD